ncbi:hypothetical protein RF11_09368 [Thelohanellus kitauei]|uniref:RDD domain-containing protein n=1 Tax=Thelohanellus kitauei TaxID=669202 RepID=A0A0C2I912_THEKT|nr:hypothetical protein RF11_09368 [Thelohanellus kitauei]
MKGLDENYDHVLHQIAMNRTLKPMEKMDNISDPLRHYKFPGSIFKRSMATLLDLVIFLFVFTQEIGIFYAYEINISLLALIILFHITYIAVDFGVYSEVSGGYQTIGKYFMGLHVIDCSLFHNLLKISYDRPINLTIKPQILPKVSIIRRIQRSMLKIFISSIYMIVLPILIPFWIGPHDLGVNTVVVVVS